MGDSVNNWLPSFHFQAGGLFEAKVTRHKTNDSIDATTTNTDHDGWHDIVDAALSSMTDAEFASAVASVWPGWAASHLSGSNAGEYRAGVVKIVQR